MVNLHMQVLLTPAPSISACSTGEQADHRVATSSLVLPSPPDSAPVSLLGITTWKPHTPSNKSLAAVSTL